eukprot:7351565-Pyramimonas_sp.AAC.1
MTLITLAAPPTPRAALRGLRDWGISTHWRPRLASAWDSRFNDCTPTRSLPAPGSTRACAAPAVMKMLPVVISSSASSQEASIASETKMPEEPPGELEPTKPSNM